MATIHHNYPGRPTKGGRLDREILHEFIQHPVQMHEAAARIREGVYSGQLSDFSMVNPFDLDEVSAREGRLLARRHLARERNRTSRDRKIAAAQRDTGRLACEVCGFNFECTYGRLGRGYIKCHHVIPLHEAGERRTRLTDLALLCSNCHRMIHRQTPWLRLPNCVRSSASVPSTGGAPGEG